ncbi:MAG TPA: hypothetical protein VF627_13780 [Abditibacterium sp.]|jgi:hydroxymethylpyrimidine pyrophosphatase-like HAD family hydrolase
MNPRRALILDLDFTLLHLEWVPGSIEVPGRTRSAWVAPRTVELLGDLQARFDLVLATARSWDGTKWVVDGLQKCGVEVAALVLEDGARWGTPHDLSAFEPNFSVDCWRAKLDSQKTNGPDFEWQFDFHDCLVARCENTAASEFLFQKWSQEWSESRHVVRFFRDGRKVYALPARANKWSALQRVLGENACLAAGVGDGENDLIWLPKVAFPATFARANARLVAAVLAKSGFVSALDGHEGIAEILRRLL